MTTPGPATDAAPAGGWATLRNGRPVLVRPARGTDAPLVQDFVRGLSPLARRRRFLGAVAELAPGELDRLTRVCDPRELVLLAIAPGSVPLPVVGMAQYALERDDEADFALAVADDWHRQGLGGRLLAALLARATAQGLHAMSGEILADNWPMIGLLAAAGFELAEAADPQLVRARKLLATGRTHGRPRRFSTGWQTPSGLPAAPRR